MLAFPAFSDVLYVFNSQYTREQLVFEDSLYRWYTPLQYFSSRGIQPVVQRLLETGADANEMSVGDNKHQIAPLVHAITFRSASIVALLMHHGACVNASASDSSFSPLHVAVGSAHAISPRRLHTGDDYAARAAEVPRIVQLLLDAGADVQARSWSWTGPKVMQTVLQTACATVNASPVVVRSLITAGADMSCVGTTPLPPVMIPPRGRRAIHEEAGIALIHYAANAGNTHVIRILLDAGADVEVATRGGMRALDLAVLHKRRDVVEILISAGADVNTGAVDGTAALDPLAMIEEAATWEQLMEWLQLRGWRGRKRSLFQWCNSGRDPLMPPGRAGQAKFFKSMYW